MASPLSTILSVYSAVFAAASLTAAIVCIRRLVVNKKMDEQRAEEQHTGRNRVEQERARQLAERTAPAPHDGSSFQSYVVNQLRAIRAEISLMLHMEEVMDDQLAGLKAAADAAKASADRANANTEKVLAKVDALAVDLKNALAAGADPAALKAIADELAGVSASLDAESAKVDGDATVNPVTATPSATPSAGA